MWNERENCQHEKAELENNIKVIIQAKQVILKN